jgi:hypothetical protein
MRTIYLSKSFKGSILEKTILSLNSKEQLQRGLQYQEMAVQHWKKENDIEQTNFFQDAVNLTNKRLAKFKEG